jgi:hypothetical protein
MAGMRALGRQYDLVQGPSGLNISLKDCSGIGFMCINGTSTAAILTVTASTKFTGGTTSNWTTANGFGLPATMYTRLTGNTAAWVAQTTSWASNAMTVPITTTGAIGYIDFLVSELADTYDYINVTVSGSGATLPVAIKYDLLAARTPANLKIPVA